MFRAGYTLAVFLALAAWAGAQGPAPAPRLTAADQLRLLRANRVLLTDLVTNGVELGNADRLPDRADACRRSARFLGVALQNAAGADDPDRVAELGGHLEAVVRDGLVPILDEGKATIPPESQDAARLKVVRETAARDLNDFWLAIPEAGKVGDSGKVRDIRGRLDGLREKLK